MTTVADLIAAKTSTEFFDELITRLAAADPPLPVTAWQSGGVARTLVRVDAYALADLRAIIALVCKGGFLDEATGDWLTMLAKGVFDLDRTASVFCQGYVTLTCAAGTGPQTISAAGLVVSDGTRRWRSTGAAFTIASSESLFVPVRAESPGVAYNAANGTITTLVSPASAGLSVSNPTYASGTWITVAGAAEESDASLRARCRARWGTLGRGATDAAYLYLARTGHAYEAQVTRAQVVWGPGDGTLTVYLAGPSGVVSPTVKAAVAAWVEDGKPGTDNPTVSSVTAVSVALIAAVRVRSASDSTANRALATDALAALAAGLDIGEDLDLARLYEAILAASGVIDVDIVQPPADTSVSNGEVATITPSITWEVV